MTDQKPALATDKRDELRARGADAVIMDGLDATAVAEAIARARPDATVHQMTALARMER